MRRFIARLIRLAILTVMLCCAFHLAGAETWYVENDLNYLDTAMDVSNGIPEDADGDLGRIREKGVLRVAADFGNAPMCFEDPEAEGDDRYAGVDMELARLIAQKMGVKLVVIPKETIFMLPALIEDLCDLTISAIPYTPATALSYTLSNAYYYPEQGNDVGILIREDETITSLTDLENKTIAAQSNSLEEVFAAAQISNYLEFRRPISARKVFEMVRDGTVYAGVVSTSVAEVYFQNNPDCGLRLVEAEELNDPENKVDFSLNKRYLGYRVAAKKGENWLIAFVNGVIDEANEEGLFDRWLKEAAERAGKLGLTGRTGRQRE